MRERDESTEDMHFVSLVTEGRQILTGDLERLIQSTRKGSLLGFLHRHHEEPGSHSCSFSLLVNTVRPGNYSFKEQWVWTYSTVQSRTQEENENKSEQRNILEEERTQEQAKGEHKNRTENRTEEYEQD